MSGPARRSPAAAYLASRTRFGIKFGLETMQALLEALGRPAVACPTLLIAGTNGKGSVAAYVDAALRAAGLRCGRYTSPHLVRVNERITVGGEEIPPAALRPRWARCGARRGGSCARGRSPRTRRSSRW